MAMSDSVKSMTTKELFERLLFLLAELELRDAVQREAIRALGGHPVPTRRANSPQEHT